MSVITDLEAKASEASHVVYEKDENGNTTGVPSGYVMVDEPFNGSGDMQFAVYRAQDNSGIIIAFRGTEGATDWLNNGNLGWSQWENNRVAAMEQIDAAIAEIRTDNPGATITVTGHSLGGMLAQYATYDIQKLIDVSGLENKLSLYTEGSPGVAGKLGAEVIARDGSYDSSVFDDVSIKHFYKPDDLVPRLSEAPVGGAETWYEVPVSTPQLAPLESHDHGDYAARLVEGATVNQTPLDTLNVDPLVGMEFFEFIGQVQDFKAQVGELSPLYFVHEHIFGAGIMISGFSSLASDPQTRQSAGQILDFIVDRAQNYLTAHVNELAADVRAAFDATTAVLHQYAVNIQNAAISVADAAQQAAQGWMNSFFSAGQSVLDVMNFAGEKVSDLIHDLGGTSHQVSGGGETITGTEAGDMFSGTAGSDVIHGLGGGDRIMPSGGNDAIYGGEGNDYVQSGNGDDFVDGGNGNDIVKAYGGNDVIQGGEGTDQLDGGDGNDVIYGGAGNDSLFAGTGSVNILYGGDGDDNLRFFEFSSSRKTNPGDRNYFYGGAGLSGENREIQRLLDE